MTQPSDVGRAVPRLPELATRARGMIRWVCTKNPFYVVSAGLFLLGLKVSFGDPALATDTWAMMAGLAGYTLLLAATACLLVRFGNVWDDIRTVLLLVVLMFLATSVTFDEVLVLTPQRGVLCYLLGLALAVAVSETVLRGIRLNLPAWFRGPYYLLLGLFFIYPLVLNLWVNQPRSEAMLWGLYGFGPVAGLIFLTLLPAIRRGPEYVRGNGSPWPWPLYPWTLFGMLALAVPARSLLLCWSMHLLDNSDRDALVFGPHFLAPFGLAIAVLLLGIGLQARRRGPVAVALGLPALMVLFCLFGHRPDAIYGQFLEVFRDRVGGYPAFATLLAAGLFYGYAALRRAPLAMEAVTAALVALGFVGPATLAWGDWTAPQTAPLLAAGVLQLLVGILNGASWQVLLGSTVTVLAFSPWGAGMDVPYRAVVLGHLIVAAMLTIAALFDDPLALILRVIGTTAVLLACIVVLFAPLEPFGVPAWLSLVYPLAMAALLAVYGLWLGEAFAVGGAVVMLLLWLASQSWVGYLMLRQAVRGLDYLAGSLLFLALAVFVSLAKAGALRAKKPG
jgi:hypothetical protein